MEISSKGKIISSTKKLSKNNKAYYKLELLDENLNIVSVFCDEETYIKSQQLGAMSNVFINYEITRDRFYSPTIKLKSIERV